jgi:hypothetical protein
MKTTPLSLCKLELLAICCTRNESAFEEEALRELDGLAETALCVLAGALYAHELIEEARWVADYAQAVRDGQPRPDRRLFMRQGEHDFKQSA